MNVNRSISYGEKKTQHYHRHRHHCCRSFNRNQALHENIHNLLTFFIIIMMMSQPWMLSKHIARACGWYTLSFIHFSLFFFAMFLHSVSFLSNQWDIRGKRRKFAYIFRNYDVFTVHKINKISPYLEIVCQQIFFSWWNFKRLPNWDCTQIRRRELFPSSFQSRQFFVQLTCESEVVLLLFSLASEEEEEEAEMNIKYSRDFAPVLYFMWMWICKKRVCMSEWVSGSVCVNAYDFQSWASCWTWVVIVVVVACTFNHFLKLVVVFKRTAKIHHFHTLDWH